VRPVRYCCDCCYSGGALLWRLAVQCQEVFVRPALEADIAIVRWVLCYCCVPICPLLLLLLVTNIWEAGGWRYLGVLFGIIVCWCC
jgi:hypothetical protein